VFSLFASHPGGAVANAELLPQLSVVQHIVTALLDKDCKLLFVPPPSYRK
jgi:hypothetical protein